MRFISIKELKKIIPNELIDEFEDLTQMIKNMSDEEAKALIRYEGNIWSKLKPYFEVYFHGKCWYTESRNPMSNNDMDHFRPKSEVKEDQNHNGYWWLAYNFENYRFSCQYSNRFKTNEDLNETGGKNAKFPLLNPDERNHNPNSRHAERPELLDPCNEADHGYLTYDFAGNCQCLKSHSAYLKRFESTRLIYNLNYPTLVEDRKILYSDILELTELGDLCVDNADAIKKVQNILQKKMSHEAPYSLAAESFVRGFRDKNWIDELF